MATITDADVIRTILDGVDGWLVQSTGRFIPLIAGADGADDDEKDEEKDESETDSEEDDEQEEDDSDDEEDSDEEDDSEDALPDAVKAILSKERKARRDAEKRARQAERKLKAKPKPKPKPTAKKVDEADDDGDETVVPDTGTVKLRKANLLTALADEGYAGKQARMLARLLDDVDYTDDDEPVDLTDALEALEEEYGTELVAKTDTPARRKAPKVNGRDGRREKRGPRLSAEEMQYAEAFGMTAEEYATYKAGQLPKEETKK